MTSFYVMAPPDMADPVQSAGDAGRLVFVPDRFSPYAFAFSLVWILWHRLWLVLLGYLAVTLVLELAALSIGGVAAATTMFAISLLFGFEAQNMRRWSLERKGWQVLGHVHAGDREEAELRFFHALALRPARAGNPAAEDRPKPRQTGSIVPRIGSEQVIGLTLGPETRK
ncbi:MAG: DUF2628 domain-containing protein [Roseibium sp.]|nr:DUF2628 domain-containing protein [Roseibium sp.]